MASTPEQTADEREVVYTDPSELPWALHVSEKLRVFVDKFGRAGTWMFIPMIVITVWDVVIRKIRYTREDDTMVSLQLWLINNVSEFFGSTLLQELEWHSHTALWACVLGYGYIWNTHVRVDLVREVLAFRKKVWIEFIGLTFFLLPYTAIVIWFAFEYAYDSYVVKEISASTVGLSHRWIIKSVLVLGLGVAWLAGLAVWLQIVIVLWGPQGIRFPLMTVEWPEDEGKMIEGKERLDLEKIDEDVLEKAREKALGKRAVDDDS